MLPHVGLAFRLALRLSGGDRHEAEDLVQETFLRAHRAFERFELREYGAKPWLLKILHHVFYTRRRRAAREPASMPEINGVDRGNAGPELPVSLLAAGQVDWDSFDQELKSAIDQLPHEFRATLLLWALGDLAYREIADITGCPIGTVMSRLHRARRMLCDLLAEYGRERGLIGEAQRARRTTE